MNFLRRALSREKTKRKEKQKKKREYLYRDWPPDLVDTFLAWEHRKRIGEWSPKGYVAWQEGQSYAQYKADPHKDGVIMEWR